VGDNGDKGPEAKPGTGKLVDTFDPLPRDDDLPFHVNTCMLGGYALTDPNTMFGKSGWERAYTHIVQYQSRSPSREGRRPHQVLRVSCYGEAAKALLMTIKKGQPFLAIGYIRVPGGMKVGMPGENVVELVAHYVLPISEDDARHRKWVHPGNKR